MTNIIGSCTPYLKHFSSHPEWRKRFPTQHLEPSFKFTTDPKNLDIDHVVPLQAAHLSGAFTWVGERKRAYANDLGNPNALIAVQAGANRSKGNKDPAQWLSSNAAFYCSYISMWVEVKALNDLAYGEDEVKAIEGIMLSSMGHDLPQKTSDINLLLYWVCLSGIS